jgi:hypothetical protein
MVRGVTAVDAATATLQCGLPRIMALPRQGMQSAAGLPLSPDL